MATRLVLIRHGRSAHARPAGWLDRAGVADWRVACDAAGIAAADTPPPRLVAMAATADRIFASDLARALASAERLAPLRAIEVSPLLRETPLPIPRLPAALPWTVWETLIHLRWGVRIVMGAEAAPAEVARAAAAVAWLNDAVTGHMTGLIVTHGVFRRLLGQQLVAHGWRSLTWLRPYHPWSVWVFQRG